MGGARALESASSRKAEAQVQASEPRPPRGRMRIIRMALSTPLEAQAARGNSVHSGMKRLDF
uniref:HDC05187 n=1 Tax=Drosophila melanogaster TaxID=7227 RepID=Q6IGU3_DROME|nr:TPA_inf: HDC05187 [Drosophila melanogaster]